MKSTIEDVLVELGWTNNSFKIPIANEENKRIEEQISQKLEDKEKLKNELECLHKLVTIINKNAGRFLTEQEQNNKLIITYSARIEMEKSLHNTAHMKNAKILKEIQNCDKTRKYINSNIEELKSGVIKLKHKIQKRNQTIKQKENYLVQCENEITEKDRCTQLIEEIGVEDDKKLKVTYQLEKFTNV